MTEQQKKFKEYELKMQVITEGDERGHEKSVTLFKEAMELFGMEKEFVDEIVSYMNELQGTVSHYRQMIKRLLHEQAESVVGEY